MTIVNENQLILVIELCVIVRNLADTVEFPEGFEVSLAANTIRGTAAGELSQCLSNLQSLNYISLISPCMQIPVTILHL